jgi:RNA polymerase sigma-70 factor (ECF subfamily)
MFFRNSEKQTVLNLNADDAQAGELTAGILVSSQPNLSIEDKVKQYFEQMREPVFRYLTATFGPERAEEITQDAFLQLYRSLSSGQTILNVRAWTFRVAHNIAVTQLKRQQFIAPLTDEDWEELQRSVEGKELTPEQILLQKEKLERLRKAIGRLTLIERECLNLRTKGFRYREIGEILDISARRVADTLYRVIDKLGKDSNG